MTVVPVLVLEFVPLSVPVLVPDDVDVPTPLSTPVVVVVLSTPPDVLL